MTYRYGIKWIENTDSTNNEVQRQMKSLNNLSVVAALNQTEGRGQRGNTWHSENGRNLTFSILLKFRPDDSVSGFLPYLDARKQFYISILATVSVACYLEKQGIDVRIKWPNDIYAGNRKICGMLVENGLSGNRVANSIVGIGLNVNQTAFDPSLTNPVSMKKITGLEYDIVDELENLMEVFAGLLPLLKDALGRHELENMYLDRMYRRGEMHEYRDYTTSTNIMAKIKGISEQGLLQVEMPDNQIKYFSFKEIGYII